MRKISIIVPVYNEEKTLTQIITKLQKVSFSNLTKELIIVNDGSKDRSEYIIKNLLRKYNNITYIKHEKNSGKGAAIRTGLRNFTGDIVVIQDGDLEYDPNDLKKLLVPLLKGKADVVYGSRLLGKIRGFSIASHYYGNIFLSWVTTLLYGKRVTDMETCYKMMKAEVARSLVLRSNKFDIEPEITAKILKKRYKLIEIPINYNARSFEEGKKITWRDGIQALLTLIYYRFYN